MLVVCLHSTHPKSRMCVCVCAKVKWVQFSILPGVPFLHKNATQLLCWGIRSSCWHFLFFFPRHFSSFQATLVASSRVAASIFGLLHSFVHFLVCLTVSCSISDFLSFLYFFSFFTPSFCKFETQSVYVPRPDWLSFSPAPVHMNHFYSWSGRASESFCWRPEGSNCVFDFCMMIDGEKHVCVFVVSYWMFKDETKQNSLGGGDHYAWLIKWTSTFLCHRAHIVAERMGRLMGNQQRKSYTIKAPLKADAEKFISTLCWLEAPPLKATCCLSQYPIDLIVFLFIYFTIDFSIEVWRGSNPQWLAVMAWWMEQSQWANTMKRRARHACVCAHLCLCLHFVLFDTDLVGIQRARSAWGNMWRLL